MKKIFIALALILSVQVVNAQVKTPSEAKKAVQKAEDASKDAKKATKVATWLTLAKAYVAAHESAVGNVMQGSTRQELQFTMANEKVLSQEQVEVGGQPMVKDVYANKNLYFDANGRVVYIEVTKPTVKDALQKAVDAYKKAYEVDVKKSKEKDVKAGLELIQGKFEEIAFLQYQLGDLAGSSASFLQAAKAVEGAPVNVVDSTSIYYAGFTAWAAGDMASAEKLFQQCREIGYYYEDGEVYSKLGDIYMKSDRKAQGAEILKEGFVKFPQSQSILIGLINYYIESGENQNELFALLDIAKKNEPTNASLYYVEGNIHKQLGHEDEAIASYQKSYEINPDYVFGLVGLGQLYYDRGIAIAEKAQNEYDDRKYEALLGEYKAAMLQSIEPFETVFNKVSDEGLKKGIAEYLKNIYYRFVSDDQKYMDGYKKYDEYLKAN